MLGLLRYGVAWSDLACVSTGQVAAVQDGPLGVGTWSRVPLGRRVMTSVGAESVGRGSSSPRSTLKGDPAGLLAAGCWRISQGGGRGPRGLA